MHYFFEDLIRFVVFLLIMWGICFAVDKYQAKRDKEKQDKCPHDQCKQIAKNTTFDTNLNQTEIITLRCLNCKKVIEVKK